MACKENDVNKLSNFSYAKFQIKSYLLTSNARLIWPLSRCKLGIPITETVGSVVVLLLGSSKGEGTLKGLVSANSTNKNKVIINQ